MREEAPGLDIALGRALAPLRESGVLVVGSGSLTHNLYEFAARTSTSAQYAEEFARWVREAVVRKDTDSLLSYRSEAPHAERAHPTEEHFLPLLVALGGFAPPSEQGFVDDPTRTEAQLVISPETPQPFRLAYLGEPLTKPLRISGTPRMHVTARIDAASTPLSAVLVRPRGMSGPRTSPP